MWCLETIVKLNETAAKLAKQGRPTTEAYALCGIKTINTVSKPKEESECRPLKVVNG